MPLLIKLNVHQVPIPQIGAIPVTPTVFRVVGVTKDSTGTALAGCTVKLYRSRDDALIDQTVSDAAGNYSFASGSTVETYYIVAYKPGAPDVAGTTVNTLLAA